MLVSRSCLSISLALSMLVPAVAPATAQTAPTQTVTGQTSTGQTPIAQTPTGQTAPPAVDAAPVEPPAAPLGNADAKPAEKPKQLVMISFDGAHDNALWQRSREMATRNGAHFTYFLSCTFLMNKEMKKAYQAPYQKAGRSNVGFAQSDDEIRQRLDNIWNASLEGNEISSHGCGHFDGRKWSEANWSQEYTDFRDTLRNAWKGVGLQEPQGWRDLVDDRIRGFRAPYLSTTEGADMIAAEKKSGFTYDASLVTKGPTMPVEEGGIIRFGLPLIPEGPRDRPIIGMDYNLFVRHSKGEEDKAESKQFEDRAYAAFKRAFDKQYAGDRIPLQLGFHFVEMNGGAYWRALDRLVSDVCRRDDVDCVSYSEAIPLIKARGKLKTTPASGL
ncbi:polysaccharide deacetylase [Rhizobium metallidurans]|uniref:Peptidoglycan/xylan/chitin deacetylase (PgdA/CDA1 family) n=1 Tax=Rhizobium metallidurans TaxID=1265931 RepID=A0A7W6CTK2_9HYPH|nr:polysaccharide deacetylase [Rhizobium metallidurans]MBB3966917.1 peptidoglycan/xylan/chitin deacetylase (PgdA/CDA1 family) [Rhizobium metallidurans]